MAIDSRGGSTEAAGAARTTRNGDAARAVRSTRTRLHERRNTHPDFAREMLILHINAVLQGAAAMPVLVIVAAGLGIYFSGDYAAVLPWACLTLGGYLGLVLLAHRAQRVTFDRTATIIWARRFFLAHCAIGLCWTAFALSECESCAEPSFSFYKGVILLVALAATAMATFTLRHIVAASFAAPALIFAGNAAWFGESGFELAMALVVVTAFGYFIFLSDRLFRSNIKLLSFQSEKVALIAELEIAKAMSDEARLRAEEANLAKSRFLASMSHELRTPLNAILGFSEVMSGEVLGPLSNPTYKDYAGDIHRSGEHLLNLINEILDLSRIEAGRYELNEGSVSLAETALGCIGMIDLKARSKSITLEHRFERAMPQVWADERAMRQVILNLLSNAVKFTPAGGHVTVKVGWTAGGGQYVSVRDDGPGIPENEIPIVLSAFGQGSVAIKGAEQGTGLGLPIVKAILDKHGGTLILRSRPGEGTQAIAILPAERVLQSIQPAAEPQAEEPASERRVMALGKKNTPAEHHWLHLAGTNRISALYFKGALHAPLNLAHIDSIGPVAAMTIATFPADWQRHAISGASANQFGTIPYRIEAAGPLFLAVTSRRTGRWIFPKGNLMTGLSPSASAQEEAFEEAGVRGTIETTPLGAYGTLKQRPEQTTLINVFAFALRVEEVHEDWPEKHQRTRRWMNAQELAAVLSDPGAVALTIKLAERLASPPPLATADR